MLNLFEERGGVKKNTTLLRTRDPKVYEKMNPKKKKR
jgi:hypothetical protein